MFVLKYFLFTNKRININLVHSRYQKTENKMAAPMFGEEVFDSMGIPVKWKFTHSNYLLAMIMEILQFQQPLIVPIYMSYYF